MAYLNTLTTQHAPAPGATVRATSGRTIARGTVTARTWRNGALHSVTVTTPTPHGPRHHVVVAGIDSWQHLATPAPLAAPLAPVTHLGTWRPAAGPANTYPTPVRRWRAPRVASGPAGA